jgi:hypothetical protein
MGRPKPLTIDEWMELTNTTNRELSRLTESIDPDLDGVSEGTIRGVRRGENTTLRVARLLVEASKAKPAHFEGQKCWIWWETLYDL